MGKLADEQVKAALPEVTLWFLTSTCCCGASEEDHPTDDCWKFVESGESYARTGAAWPLARALAQAIMDKESAEAMQARTQFSLEKFQETCAFLTMENALLTTRAENAEVEVRGLRKLIRDVDRYIDNEVVVHADTETAEAWWDEVSREESNDE